MLISTLHVCFGLMSYVGTYVVNMLGPRSRQVGWFIVLSRCIKLGLRGKNTHCLRQHHKRAFASLFGSFQRANTQHTTQHNTIKQSGTFSILINIKPYSNYSFFVVQRFTSLLSIHSQYNSTYHTCLRYVCCTCTLYNTGMKGFGVGGCCFCCWLLWIE